MLGAIRNFFDQYIAGKEHEPAESAEHRARLAAAALLVEVVRSDEQVSEAERRSLLASVQRRFGFSGEEAQRLLALAEREVHEAHDLFQFTSRIRANFSAEQRARLIEELWRAAYADGSLHSHEEHVIRRVADLLHVRHSAFIAAKLRALAARERGE